MAHIQIERALRKLDSLQAINNFDVNNSIADTLINPDNGRKVIFDHTSSRNMLIQKHEDNKNFVIISSSVLLVIFSGCAGSIAEIIYSSFKSKQNPQIAPKLFGDRSTILWGVTASLIGLGLNKIYNLFHRISDIRQHT